MADRVVSLQLCEGERMPMRPVTVARFDLSGMTDDRHRSPRSAQEELAGRRGAYAPVAIPGLVRVGAPATADAPPAREGRP